jgi:hypothetical protein
VRLLGVSDRSEAASFRWHPTLYRILSFGHVPAAVDWLLLRFITDGNIAKIKDDESTEVYRILNLATELDPAFYSLYTAGSNFLAVVRNDKQGALRLLEKGQAFLEGPLKRYPESFRSRHWVNPWRIPFTLGYVYLFEFQDMARAAQAYGQLGNYPDAPEALRNMSQSVRTPEGQFNIAFNSLNVIRKWNEEDERYQADINHKQKLVLLGRDLYFFNQEFQKFLKKKPPSQSEFERFRALRSLPKADGMGGEIFLNSEGRIDTRTLKVPVFGMDIDALIRDAK